MAQNNVKLAQPKLLNLPQLAKIHVTHPEIGKALQQILEYINKNVTPAQGNKVDQ